jgi:hypothetical protein
VTLPPGHTGHPKENDAFQRNGLVQYFRDYDEPVFFHQMNMNDATACEHVAYPNQDKRPHAWTYCARLHRECDAPMDPPPWWLLETLRVCVFVNSRVLGLGH